MMRCFRPEVYCPGASPVALIEKYAGDFATFPATTDNPYWTRLTTWWIDWDAAGRPPRAGAGGSGRVRRVEPGEPGPDDEPRDAGLQGALPALRRGADVVRARYLPAAINTSLIDFDGNLKPAALAVREVWRGE